LKIMLEARMTTQAVGSTRGRLTRQRVLGTALALVDREGLDALSMRRLAADLDVEAMALYRYAPGKEALLAGLVEQIFGELHERLDAGEALPGLREELHRLGQAAYQVAASHPHVMPLLVTRLITVPTTQRSAPELRMPERVFAALHAAGVDDRTAVATYRAFSVWVLGSAIVDRRVSVDTADEPEPAFRLGLHRLHRDYPRLRALAPIIAESDGAEDFRVGLEALFDSLGLPKTTRTRGKSAAKRRAAPRPTSTTTARTTSAEASKVKGVTAASQKRGTRSAKTAKGVQAAK
jgi:AcrR family transcriptional regulator